jgi:glycosyltransferase involved in cell wall biosynthesis
MQGISVIVCCYNSVDLLLPTLEHLAKQQVSEGIKWEVVLVDNASTDGTAAFARSEWDKYNIANELRIVYEAKPGLINARIKGTNEAKYNVLVSCDDDNWLDCDYVENAHRVMYSNERIGICGGLGTAVYETGERPAWLSDYVERGYALGAQADIIEGPVAKDRFYIHGAGMVIRKSVINKIYHDLNHSNLLLSGRKGKTLAAGDDTAISFFVLMMGYELWYSADLKFKHFLAAKRLTKDYALRMYEGFGFASAHIKLYHAYLPVASRLKRIMYSTKFTNVVLQFYDLLKDSLFFPDKLAKPFYIKMKQAGFNELKFKKKFLKELH